MLAKSALALALAAVTSILVCSEALAASKRGHAVAVATVRVEVDLDASTVTVESAGGKLPGVTLEAALMSFDPMAQLATLAVSVRNDSDRTLLHDIEAELLGGPAELDPVGNWAIASEVLYAGTSSGTVPWAVFSGELRKWSMKIRLRAAVPLLAGEGATIRRPGGLRVTVPEGAMPYEALVDVETVDEVDAEADPGDMQWVGGVRLTLQPTSVHSAMPPPDLPFELRIASKQDPGPTDEYLVALRTDSENVAEDELQQGSEQTPHWLPLAHALLQGGKLRSAKDLLGGVLHAGTYGFFRTTPRLYVRGTTNDASGPRSGTIVRASHSPIVAVSDPAGSYVLAVPAAASVVVTALDPVRGQRGVAAAGGLGGARSVNLNVTLAPMSGEVVTRDGLRNGGFENDDLSNWVATPAVVASTTPLACSAGSVTASEGATMASLTTVAPDVPASSLSQPIDVPAGVRNLTFDYNVLSTEFTTGSPAPDFFVATVVTPGGELEVVRVVADDATGTTVIGDCGDGENWAETGWRSASIDLSALSTEPATRVRIVLSVSSAIDSSLPTRVFVDNFRFATLWVAPKLVDGATGDEARSAWMTESATMILRQAGINVRSRPLQAIADPNGAGGVVSITPWGFGDCNGDLSRQDIYPTVAMTRILTSGRSANATDLNAWWVLRFSGQAGRGYAVGPDDFCTRVRTGVNDGILLVDGTLGNALAHEAGHLLISPQSTGNGLEHESEPGNFMISNSPTLGFVSRTQSTNINRVANPYLLP